MKRYQRILEWLNHDQHPADQQSPVLAAAGAALVSLVLLTWLEQPGVSTLRPWWVELAFYACVPVLLAFIALYRSAWHRQTAAAIRAWLAAGYALVIFAGVLAALTLALTVVCLLYFAYGGLNRFHY